MNRTITVSHVEIGRWQLLWPATVSSTVGTVAFGISSFVRPPLRLRPAFERTFAVNVVSFPSSICRARSELGGFKCGIFARQPSPSELPGGNPGQTGGNPGQTVSRKTQRQQHSQHFQTGICCRKYRQIARLIANMVAYVCWKRRHVWETRRQQRVQLYAKYVCCLQNRNCCRKCVRFACFAADFVISVCRRCKDEFRARRERELWYALCSCQKRRSITAGRCQSIFESMFGLGINNSSSKCCGVFQFCIIVDVLWNFEFGLRRLFLYFFYGFDFISFQIHCQLFFSRTSTFVSIVLNIWMALNLPLRNDSHFES